MKPMTVTEAQQALSVTLDKLAGAEREHAGAEREHAEGQLDHVRLLEATRGSCAASDLAALETSRQRLAGLEDRRRDQAQLVEIDQRRADEAERALRASEADAEGQHLDKLSWEPVALAKALQPRLREVATDVVELVEARERAYAALPQAARPVHRPVWSMAASVVGGVEQYLFAVSSGLLCKAGQALTPHSAAQRPDLIASAEQLREYLTARRSAQ